MSRFLALLLGLSATLTLPAEQIRFKNGDVVRGTITRRANGQAFISAENFGPMVVDESRLAEGEPPTPSEGGSAPPPAPRPSPVAVPSNDAAAVANLSAPGPLPSGKAVWKRSFSVAASHSSAVYPEPPDTTPTAATANRPGSSTQVTATLSLARVTARDTLSFTGELTFAQTEPWGRQVNDHSADLVWTHALSDTTRAVSRTAYNVDRVRNIDYAAYQFGGIALSLLDEIQTKVVVTPGLVVMRDRKDNRFDDQTHAGAGLHLAVTHLFNEQITIEQTLFLRQSVRDGAFWVVDADTTFNARLTANIALYIKLRYGYDHTFGQPSILPTSLPGPNRDSLQLRSGVEFQF